ncbi:hypothetical protein MPHO_27260 [Mycolicibacterium phocaicum]|nr:hypothetical protein MPHO_27260 [Mycolicibacterium phocaicum]
MVIPSSGFSDARRSASLEQSHRGPAATDPKFWLGRWASRGCTQIADLARCMLWLHIRGSPYTLGRRVVSLELPSAAAGDLTPGSDNYLFYLFAPAGPASG